MKRLALLSLTCLLAASQPVRATDRIPIQTTLCYPADGLSAWSYLPSSRTRDGLTEQAGYVVLDFTPYRSADGKLHHQKATLKVAGLEWDSRYRRLLAKGIGFQPSVLCAAVGRWGQIEKREENCWIEGRVVADANVTSECGPNPSYLFDGSLVIAR